MKRNYFDKCSSNIHGMKNKITLINNNNKLKFEFLTSELIENR